MGQYRANTMEDRRIRRLREGEWESFRALRLEALRTDPRSFGSSYERESAYPVEKWKGWADGGATGQDQATFVAEEPSGRWIGMVGVFAHEQRPHIWGMWVHPAHRRRGVGGALLSACLRWIDAAFPPGEALLEVNPEVEAAVRTYQNAGFEFNGVTMPLGHWEPKSLARQMVRKR